MARILTLTNWYPPHALGGYEVVCQDVMNGLHSRGHQIEVLCSDELVPGASGNEGRIPVHRLLKMYWKDSVPWTPPLGHQLRIERANQEALKSTIRRFRPDVVSVWHMGAISLSLLSTVERSGIPMVYGVCDDWLTYGVELDPWSKRWNSPGLQGRIGRVVGKILRLPTTLGDIGKTGCFCFISAVTRQRTRELSHWTYPIAPVVHAGVDRTSCPAPENQNAASWDWKLLYVGRADPRKGTDTLLSAMSLLPKEATLTFLSPGEGPEHSRLLQLAAELGVADQVHFGSMDHSLISTAYLSHDLLIFPSEWPEPFGLVPLESMACGTPVVATGVGGSAEFLRADQNCVLFQAGNADELAASVLRVAGNDDLRMSLRLGGWATAEEFDVSRTVSSYERIHVAVSQGRLSELGDEDPHSISQENPH